MDPSCNLLLAPVLLTAFFFYQTEVAVAWTRRYRIGAASFVHLVPLWGSESESESE